MAILNLSFAACGFMGIYHLGAVGAFLRHGDKLLGSLRACAGASGGALVAAVLITAPDKLEHCTKFTYEFAESVRQQRFGGITPGFNFMLILRSGKNRIVSRFPSRDELIMALLASSFVPLYAGLRPVEFSGQKWIDGGFTDSLPILPVGRTITVSPFAGLQDVCPVHRGHFNTKLNIANMKIMFSMENIKRLNQALFPPSLSTMHAIYEEGHTDAVRFLKREDLMSWQP
ncbi:patatin-like phospholipase domain-containing protein 4 isoform X2 [Gambusia affinis]|uniref:patatin-like phospholipase domain-containing protein 4 isoform X2 n=1 Tax=Gambusia affinis TaxID=33528 RepID=UPI001CDCEE80|nr:patatin-like phospholipase domain-containing protein 4 isoform X2 [Gambusia affinis]